MVKAFKLLTASTLALVSTLALSYTTITLPLLLDSQLREVYPDLFYFPDKGLMGEFVNQVRPLGYASLLLASAMILLGFISNRRGLTTLGTVAFFLPTFASFAYSMFFLAGLGITRVMWIPLIDVYPLILRLGDIALIPLIPISLIDNLWGGHDLTWLLITLAGLAVFFVGVVTWFYAKLDGRDVISFWVYRYSRHPQYLGLIVMSYGLMIGVSGFTVIADNEFFTTTQSFPWVVSTLILVCIAFTEEIDMLGRHDKVYEEYRARTPFMLPLPRFASRVLTAPARRLLGTGQPTRRREVAYFFAIYCITSVVLSIPFMLIFR